MSWHLTSETPMSRGISIEETAVVTGKGVWTRSWPREALRHCEKIWCICKAKQLHTTKISDMEAIGTATVCSAKAAIEPSSAKSDKSCSLRDRRTDHCLFQRAFGFMTFPNRMVAYCHRHRGAGTPPTRC